MTANALQYADTYTPREVDKGDLMWDPGAFGHGWDLAVRIAASQLCPKRFQGKPADVWIALDMAHRMSLNPTMVLQSLYVVHGSPGWSSQFLIALAANAGFPIRFKIDRKPGAPAIKGFRDLCVTAWSPKLEGEEVPVDTQMAIDAGWTSNEVYKKYLEQMLCYRAASLWVSRHCPHVKFGLPSVEELDEISVEAVSSTPSVPLISVQEAAAAMKEPPKGLDAMRAAAAADKVAEPEKVADPRKDAAMAAIKRLREEGDEAKAALREAAQPHFLKDLDRLSAEKLEGIVTKARALLEAKAAKPAATNRDDVIGEVLTLEGRAYDSGHDVGANEARIRLSLGLTDEGRLDVDKATTEQLVGYRDALRALLA